MNDNYFDKKRCILFGRIVGVMAFLQIGNPVMAQVKPAAADTIKKVSIKSRTSGKEEENRNVMLNAANK